MQLLSNLLEEELKSQPLLSPVPTPAFPSLKPEPEPFTEVENQAPVKKIVSTDIIQKIVEIEVEHFKKEVPVLFETELKPKQELEVQLTLEVDVSPRSEMSGGSGKTQLEAPPPLVKQDSDKRSETETIKTGSEERRSSESEPDSDAVSVVPDLGAEDDHERKGLFHQGESMEDELPYIPTTLPQERPVAHPIIPVKQRAPEAMKTCPIDRPRPTTPINPATLDDYMYSPHDDASGSSSIEKMQIVLPRTESVKDSRSKSPHKPAAKPWTHFAEQGLQSPRELRRVTSPSPPPLPPRGSTAPASAPAPWVCFDEVPERRRTPKRITTLPPQPSGVVYNYVNPEECSCECHDTQPQQSRVNGGQDGVPSRLNSAQSQSERECSESSQCHYKDPYRT